MPRMSCCVKWVIKRGYRLCGWFFVTSSIPSLSTAPQAASWDQCRAMHQWSCVICRWIIKETYAAVTLSCVTFCLQLREQIYIFGNTSIFRDGMESRWTSKNQSFDPNLLVGRWSSGRCLSPLMSHCWPECRSWSFAGRLRPGLAS